MNGLTHSEIIKGVRDLPSLPLVVNELIRTFDRTDANMSEVAERVSQDQALAAKTLRLANSSFYGLTRKVRTIQQAITVVGFNSVRSMIVAVGIINAFAGDDDLRFDFTAFWQHAIGVALCAKSIARMCGTSPDDAFISGLLHDIGKLVLVSRFPKQYAAVADYRGKQDCHSVEAERNVLGTDHAAVGMALAEHWKFPAMIQEVIACHHVPLAGGVNPTLQIVHVSNVIAYALDLGVQDKDMVPPISEHAWNRLHLDVVGLRRVFREVEAEFDEVCHILAA